MSRLDVVIDLETMSTLPNAAIVSIGAVAVRDRVPVGEFYVRVQLETALDVGCVVDGDTMEWWMRQDVDARQEVDGSQEAGSLYQALTDLDAWLQQTAAGGRFLVWGKGPSFECTILTSAYRAFRRDAPWYFRNERCMRTLLDLYPEAADLPFEGIQHHALHDARHEAAQLIMALTLHESRPAA